MINPMTCGALNLDQPTIVLFTAMLIAVSLVLLFFIVKSVFKERNRWSEIKGDKQAVAGEAFDEFVRKRIQMSKKTTFTLFLIEISDSQSLIKGFGEQQYDNAVDIMLSNIKLLFNNNIKIGKDRDSVLIYLKGALSVKNLNQLCNMLLAETQKSILVAGTLKMDLDVNVAVASYPQSGQCVEVLKQNLQLALVASKRRGINRFAVYDQNISNKETEEYKSYVEIKNAIENKEFTLYYQPIVDLVSLEVFGAESLLRWNHREKGVLPPSKFLDIMEHTGDINWVGFWALEQLIKQSLLWKAQYPDRKLLLSLNLSPKQLMNPQLADELRRIIKKHRINTSDFCMEIVEFALFDSVEEINGNLLKLRQMGFRIAIDNYGLEFSSLNRIEKTCIDIIKLNRNFIKQTKENEMSLQIIKMLISYAQEKDITIVAEGIENVEVLEYVKSLGIKYGQGFFFAKPGNPKELINAVILTPWQ
ncbi:MAG: EAL domain-containing protein [Clostridia bacterium]|nr:EAL domain-containing protein [Clostridia bacterium]